MPARGELPTAPISVGFVPLCSERIAADEDANTSARSEFNSLFGCCRISRFAEAKKGVAGLAGKARRCGSIVMKSRLASGP